MADEAILRVVLQGQGGAGGTPGQPGAASIPSVPGGGDGLGPLLGIAGGVGVALAAVLAAEKLKDGFNAAIDATAKFSAGLLSASTDPSQGVQLFGSATKDLGDKLFFLTGGVSGVISVFGQLTSSIGELMKAMDGTVDRYAMYSPGIAFASAQAQITQIMGEFRRAQEVTPSLIQYLQARTELQQKYEDLKARFIVQATPFIVLSMKVMERALTAIEKFLGPTGNDFDADAFRSIGDIIMEGRGHFANLFPREKNVDIPPFAR